MKNNANLDAIDFTRNPYRGTFRIIAANTGVTPQAVQRSYSLSNPRIVQLVNDEIDRRTNIVKQNHKVIKEASDVAIA